MAAITAVGGTKGEGMTVVDMTEDRMGGIRITDIAASCKLVIVNSSVKGFFLRATRCVPAGEPASNCAPLPFFRPLDGLNPVFSGPMRYALEHTGDKL